MKHYNDLLNRYNNLWNVITFQPTVITIYYNVSANRYNGFWNYYNGSDGYTGTGTGGGRRVQRVFSKKKLTGPSQTRTRLPAYTRAVRVPQIPGTGTRVRVVPDGV
jgi:hypothetical protein